MTLLIKIQDKIKECMKNGNDSDRDSLRVIIGEAQKINLHPSDEDIIKVLKKNKEGNLEMISHLKDENSIFSFKRENDLYDDFLPKTLSKDQIENFIVESKMADEIKSKKSIGQAIGFLMGFLKKNFSEYMIDGKIVSEVVKNHMELS